MISTRSPATLAARASAAAHRAATRLRRRAAARTAGRSGRRAGGRAAEPRPEPGSALGSGPAAAAGVTGAGDPRFAPAYVRLVRRVLGDGAVADAPGSHPGRPVEPVFDPARDRVLRDEATRQRALSVLAARLACGDDLLHAYVAAMRELRPRMRLRATGRALGLGLEAATGDATYARLGLGLALLDMDKPDLAWAQLRQLDRAALDVVPVEAVQCALTDGTPDAVAVAQGIADDPGGRDTEELLALAGRFLVTGDRARARRLHAEASRRPDAELHARPLANLRHWIEPPDQPLLPEGAVSVGVIDYHQPDLARSSSNLGDYVQTLAMLGNLARFGSVRFTGANGLGELAGELQDRVRPELRLAGPPVHVHLTRVSRDFSAGETLPESTWMVAFGWHLHSMFELRHGLPYHAHVNPVFVSFHVNDLRALTPQALDYLRAHGPVGCRDWTTVDLLLSADVDAFFTGCLTTTVDAVFPPLGRVQRERPGVVAVVDLPVSAVKQAGRPVEWLTHVDPEFRDADLVAGTRAAADLLATYQRRFRRVVTSRLHSYLPATALGLPVRFRPRNPSDVRFDGLTGLTPDAPELDAMRNRTRRLLASTFELVLAGAGRDQVYRHWRELTAPAVAMARERLSTPVPVRLPVDVSGLVAQVRGGMRRHGPHDADWSGSSGSSGSVTDVALSLDANFKALLPVTLESLVSSASGPLRLWITTRGLGHDYEAWLSDAFPHVPITFLECDGVDYGEVGRMIRHISIATMDRLLLPEVLHDLDRLTYVDIDTVTDGDVCELARTDLGGNPLAARTTFQSGAMQWRLAGDLLPPTDASELRRFMAARHPFDFTIFNAGVLVLDLARMRADRFVETFLPMAGRWGLNDQDLLNGYVGAGRTPLPRRWNALPGYEPVTEPGILHYAGAGKPWEQELVPEGHRWQRWTEQSVARVGSPP